MQHFIQSAAFRHGGNAVFLLSEDFQRFRLLSPRTVHLSSRKHASITHLSRSFGISYFSLHNNSVKCEREPVQAEARAKDVLATSGADEVQGFAKKIMTVLSLALAVGFTVAMSSGPAIAGPEIMLPSTASASGRHILVSAWMGLMAGCLHTLTGPDHLAALAPLSIGRTKLESVAVGALWGCGHDAGQVLFGILFLLLKGKLHIEVLRTWGARVVGMTLVTIGVLGIKEAQEAAVPCFAGEGMLPSSESSRIAPKKNINFATFATGIVHGLQPDALIMILPALALPSRIAGAAFLVTFLFGTILAMSGYTLFIGSCSHALKKRLPRITEHLSWISSLVAIFVGVSVLVGELFGLSIL